MDVVLVASYLSWCHGCLPFRGEWHCEDRPYFVWLFLGQESFDFGLLLVEK